MEQLNPKTDKESLEEDEEQNFLAWRQYGILQA
jgi:hypothetical protein